MQRLEHRGVASPQTLWRCNCEQSRRRQPCHHATVNIELTNANERAASSHQRLGLQRVRLRTLRASGRDTNRAEAIFRTMRQTMEASE